MRSTIHDVLPPKLRRALRKMGQDISVARRKRNLTVAMMTERLGVAKSTYLRVEKGDPTVATGILAMTLFILGLDEGLTKLADPTGDDQGLLLDAQRLPKRVRVKKESKTS
ncbi:MAG: hypothetical protein H6729_05845 [Deltaproteobacteria bacterium]|nr:hypothetical protein [Deltaproteobacteria bacterium]